MEAYARAGRHAADLGRNDEASAALERACHLEEAMLGATELDHDDVLFDWQDSSPAPLFRPWPERVGLRLDTAEVLRRMGEPARAAEQLHRAREILDREADSDKSLQLALIDYQEATLAYVAGQIERPLELLERALAHAGDTDNMMVERAQMYAMQAAVKARVPDPEASRAACLTGLRICRRAEHRGRSWREAVSRLLRTLGAYYHRKGRTVVAQRCYLQAFRVLDSAKQPHLAASVLINVAATRFAAQDLEGARQTFEQALSLAERSGDLWMEMAALGNLGEVEMALGRPETAHGLLEEAAQLGERVGALADLPDVYRNLARARASSGMQARAAEAALAALELARVVGGRLYLPAVLVELASLALALGDEHNQALRDALRSAARSEQDDPEVRSAAERCLALLAAAD